MPDNNEVYGSGAAYIPGTPNNGAGQASRQSSDQEMADLFKQRIALASAPIVTIMNEAKRAGFVINFSFALDYKGEMSLTPVQVSKIF
jgi:hypothetical protein